MFIANFESYIFRNWQENYMKSLIESGKNLQDKFSTNLFYARLFSPVICCY
jgi:hypothetical protein